MTDGPSQDERAALRRAGSHRITEASQVCPWCGKQFQPRRGGGSRQTFCGAVCRHRFHRSARQCAERAVAAGILSIADLRNGIPAAYTPVGEGKSPAPVSEDRKAIDLLDDLLGELLGDAFPSELLGALSEDILDRIIAYMDEPLP